MIAIALVAAWAIPNLSSGFTPQGVTTLGAWTLVAEYRDGANSRLVAIDSAGHVYGQVAVSEGHLGGVAVLGSWLFTQDNAHLAGESVRTYKVSDITSAIKRSHGLHGHPVYVKRTGTQDLGPGHFASFMAADGHYVYAGHYAHDASESGVYSYTVIASSGHLKLKARLPDPPLHTQGMTIYKGKPVYTTADELLVWGTRRVSIPLHAEGLAPTKGGVVVAFEDGAKYARKVAL